MEKILRIQIEKLSEGFYLATSDDLPGLVAQGKTITETIEIAQDVVNKLLEAKKERNQLANLESISEKFDYPLVINQ